MLSVGESQVWGLEGKSPGTQSETDAGLGHDFLLSDILKTQFFPSWYRGEGHLAAGDFSYKYQCFWHKCDFYLLFRVPPPHVCSLPKNNQLTVIFRKDTFGGQILFPCKSKVVLGSCCF